VRCGNRLGFGSQPAESGDVDDDLSEGALGQFLVGAVGVFEVEDAVDDGLDGVLVEEFDEVLEGAQVADGDALDVRKPPPRSQASRSGHPAPNAEPRRWPAAVF
jgi:hypothetical protein